MKHAVILAHPKAASFNAAVAQTYAEAARALGHDVVLRDLYAIGFDPCLKAAEMPTAAGFAPGADVTAERKLLGDADVFAFVYPLWFNAPPAILKGYVDRVFGMGFGFEPAAGGTQGLLEGRQLISFTSSGAPEEWVQQTGALAALETLFDRHVAAVCGMTVAGHVHVGEVTAGLTGDWMEAVKAKVAATVREAFAEAESVLP